MPTPNTSNPAACLHLNIYTRPCIFVGARRDEHEAAAVSSATEEAALKVDADLMAMRVQLQVSVGLIGERGKEREQCCVQNALLGDSCMC